MLNSSASDPAPYPTNLFMGNGKPLLFPSRGCPPPAVMPSEGEHFCLPAFPFLTGLRVFQRGDFPSLLRKFDLIFSKRFLKIANALSFSSYIICYPHTCLCLSIYPTLRQHFLPAGLCACWFQTLHLLWWHLNPMTVEGFFLFSLSQFAFICL